MPGVGSGFGKGPHRLCGNITPSTSLSQRLLCRLKLQSKGAKRPHPTEEEAVAGLLRAFIADLSVGPGAQDTVGIGPCPPWSPRGTGIGQNTSRKKRWRSRMSTVERVWPRPGLS